MSETTGPMTISEPPTDCLVRSCGKPLPHIEVKIKKPDHDNEGEVRTELVYSSTYYSLGMNLCMAKNSLILPNKCNPTNLVFNSRTFLLKNS